MPLNTRNHLSHRRYRRFRAAVLAEQPLCVCCHAAGRTRAAAELDHIQPLHRGGGLMDRANVQPLCADCHADKTHRDLAAHRGQLRPCVHGVPHAQPCAQCGRDGQ